MSVTVHLPTGATDSHPRANRWNVDERGNLWLIATDTTIAEYAAGAWFAVTLDEEEEQDGEADGASEPDVIANLRAMLTGAWATDKISRGSLSVNVLRELHAACW